jgi:uncharacterized protein (DUF488 family)
VKKTNFIFTIGHSTHALKEFMDMLEAYDVELLVDVRHYPGSRRFPHFNKERLQKSLNKRGIDYLHLEKLGGRRKLNKDSDLNLGWRSPQFRGYADYMQTIEFNEALKELMSVAKTKVTVIMCAEAVPWRCHRSLIADALLARKIQVFDIFNQKTARPHTFTPFAKVKGTQVTYPAEKETYDLE